MAKIELGVNKYEKYSGKGIDFYCIDIERQQGENLAATEVHKKVKNSYSIKKEAPHEVRLRSLLTMASRAS